MSVVSYSSAQARVLIHFMFKVKYCHRIFEDKQVEKRCGEILQEAAREHGMRVDCIGFDKDHLHGIFDIGLLPVWQAVKVLKGRTAKYLLKEFPHLKKKYFWGSGLWNPSYWADSVGPANYQTIQNYVQNQGKNFKPIILTGQTKLKLN